MMIMEMGWSEQNAFDLDTWLPLTLRIRLLFAINVSDRRLSITIKSNLCELVLPGIWTSKKLNVSPLNALLLRQQKKLSFLYSVHTQEYDLVPLSSVVSVFVNRL